MSISLKRQGTTQAQRFLPALEPASYAIEERDLSDHLKYLQAYAKKLRFHDTASIRAGGEIDKNEKRFWDGFLNYNEQEFTEINHLIENPELLEGQPELKRKYFKPHYSLLFTFIKLLAYSKVQTGKLTEDHLNYCYKQSLQIVRKASHADQAHVIFTIADYINQLPIAKGTSLFAGVDQQDQPVEFIVEQDILLNHAQVTDLYTVQLETTAIDLAQIREQAGEGIGGFNAMLLHALGRVRQGAKQEAKQLPPFSGMLRRSQAVTLSQLVNEWYPTIRDLTAEQMNELDRGYIFNRLNFLSVVDCLTVFDILYREIHQGAEGQQALSEKDWQHVYRILTGVHQQTHRKARIESVKIIRQEKGINGLFDWLFGMPEPGDMLHNFPKINLTDLTPAQENNINTYPLASLYYANSLASIRYIEKHLCMSNSDFRLVMSTVLGENLSSTWMPVYQVLEQAWTIKRQYVYPSVNSEKITGLTKQIHHDQTQSTSSDGIQAFIPFSAQTDQQSVAVDLGLQVQSDILSMREGIRQFDLVLDCKAGTLPLDEIASLQTLFPNDELFDVYLSSKEGWQQVSQPKITFGSMNTEPAMRDLVGHVIDIIAQSKSIFLLSDEVKSTLVGQYISLSSGHCFEILRLRNDEKLLDLRPVFYRLFEHMGDHMVDHTATQSPQLISNFLLTNESGVIQGELEVIDKTNQTSTIPLTKIITTQESFSPEQQEHYLVDNQGDVYQIEKFIHASEVQVNLLCRVKDTQLSVNKVWKTLTPEFNQELNQTINQESALNDFMLSQAQIHDPSINIQFTGDTLAITFPQECTAQQLITYWQQYQVKSQVKNQATNLATNQANSRFELKLIENQGSQTLSEIQKDLPIADKWLKRYRTLEHHGIEVNYEGRRNEIAHLTILPEQATAITDFNIIGDELRIAPAMNATANEVAAAWRSWGKMNATDNFSVTSQDQRLLTLTPVSESSMTRRDLTEKHYIWQDDQLNGCRFLYKGPSAQPASVLIKENVINDYDFDISTENELTVLYPSQSQTLGSSLIKAWDQWRNNSLNTNQGFAIELVGNDILDVVGQTTFELEAVHQVSLTNTASESFVINYHGELPVNSQLIIRENSTDDIHQTAFSFADNNIEIIIPKNQTITATLLIQHWQDWKIVNSESPLNLSFEIVGEQAFTLTPQSLNWELSGAQGKVGEQGLSVDYVKAYHPDQLAIARVLCMERGKEISSSTSSETESFSFSFDNDEFSESTTLMIYYPQLRAQRTIEKLLTDWEDYITTESFDHGFTLTLAGEASWQVSGESQFILLPSRRAFYRLSSASDAYIQFDFETIQTGVPYITMSTHAKTSYEFQFMLTDGVPNLIIAYPQDPAYQNATGLFDAWYQQADHYGFTLRDSSPRVKKRGKAKLPETGNQIKYLDFNGLHLKYTGPEQNVALTLVHQRPFTSGTSGQQLLLDSGLLFQINQKINKNVSNISLIGETDSIKQAGIYPDNSVKRHSIRLKGEVDETFAPVTAIDASEKTAPKAALKVVLNPDYAASASDSSEQEPYFLYPLLRSVVVERAHIRVNVSKIKSVLARQHQSVINLQTENSPFGSEPLPETYFEFSHPELCAKPLEALHCEFNWRELTDPISFHSNKIPALQSYYRSYALLGDQTVADLTDADLSNSLSIFRNNRWHTLGQTQNLLMSTQSYLIDGIQRDNSYDNKDAILLNDNDEDLTWQSYFRMTLHGNLWHQAFSRLQTKLLQIKQEASYALSAHSIGINAKQAQHQLVKATRIAMAEANETGQPYQAPAIVAAAELVDPRDDLQEFSEFELPAPFTPAFKSIEFAYQASSQLALVDINNLDINGLDLNSTDTQNTSNTSHKSMPLDLYRQHPFGIRQMGLTADKDDYLLPLYKKSGYLYIGLERLAAGQSVSLLFQILSGTGDSVASPPKASWFYLSQATLANSHLLTSALLTKSAGENWQKLPDAALLKDETQNLQNTGLVQISLPDDASTQHYLMPTNRIWLRVEFADNITALPTIVSVHCQAVLAKYRQSNVAINVESNAVNNDTQLDSRLGSRLEKPLPANSINALVESLPGMQKVTQPYPSVAGRAIEPEQDYYQRVAERLKHKQRCLSASDYETLVLGEFFDLHQVLCIPAKEYTANRGEIEQLLDLKLIVIAKSQQNQQALSLRPRASIDQLNAVQSLVDQHKPARVSIEVINPGFEEVTFRMAVKFKAGFDKGFYVRSLNQEIISYLSPWSYSETPSLDFAYTLYSAAVVRFIESLAYIDYVANFTLLRQVIKHTKYSEVIPLFLTEDHAATALYSGNMLVSATQHVIDVIESDIFDGDAYQGIGYMQIGSDYWVDRPGPIFSFGIGQLNIAGPRIYSELLKQENIPEFDNNGQSIWQMLLDKHYVNANFEIGAAFNTDLGLTGFDINLDDANKLRLYQLFIARRKWQPGELSLKLS